jgi:hypothetical protein
VFARTLYIDSIFTAFYGTLQLHSTRNSIYINNIARSSVKKRSLPESTTHSAEHPAGDTAIDVDEDLATPDWEIALAEVAQRFPRLDADGYPCPLEAAVTAFMRHLFDVGPGHALPGGGDNAEGKAALAGGIEDGLRRMAVRNARNSPAS